MLSTRDEQEIAPQVAEENDPQVLCLVDALLDLDRQCVQERVSLLLQLGQRYLVLALLQEDGPGVDETVPALLDRRCEDTLSFLPASHERDERALAWYREAFNVFAAVIVQAQTAQFACAAYSSRAATFAALGKVEAALEDFTRALGQATAIEQQADIYYLRGIALAQQGKRDVALVDLSYALDLNHTSDKYQKAQNRLAQV